MAKGVFTDPPENDVVVQNADDLDDFTAGTDDAQKVFARLTESHPSSPITGTWTFTNATFSVTGVGGLATSELQPGDVVLAPDGLYYTVDVINNDDDFTIIEPFAGTTGPIVSPAARRWVLTFYVNDEGVETPVSPGAGVGFPSPANIRWHYEEVFDVSDRPVRNPIYSVPSDQVAAEVPDASETVKGKAVFSVNKGTAALEAVQASDDRLDGPNAVENAETLDTNNHGPIRIIEGAGAVISYAFVGGEHQFTIGTSATPFPNFSTTDADLQFDTGVTGFVGNSGEIVHSNHVHPRSTEYTNRDGIETLFEVRAGVTTTFSTVALPFRPRFVINTGQVVSEFFVGLANGTNVGNQAYKHDSGLPINTGLIAGDNNANAQTYRLDGTFTRGNVLTWTRLLGVSAADILILVVGDNADL